VTTPSLSDIDARLAIRHDLPTTLFVEAGAGTGKTSELVSRIAELVTVGEVPIGEIAAITFTEKAASELRDRVRTRLEAIARSSVATAGRARAALDDLDDAPIGTLHGFAQRLLVERPVEIELPPAIEVLDEVSSQLAFDERWRRAYDQMLDDPTMERTLLLAFGAGVKEAQLRELARQANDNWDLVAQRMQLPRVEPPTIDVAQLVAQLRACAAAREWCTAESDSMLDALDKIAAYADLLESTVDEFELMQRLQSNRPRFPTKLGQKQHWDGHVEEARARIGACKVACDALVDDVAHAMMRRLAIEIGAFTLQSADERRREGKLEFHDLLVLARSLLRHPTHGAEVRQAFSQRYRRLLVDEFQDTDPIQIDLAVLLTSDDAVEPEQAWTDIVPAPGRLFVVGDPKQSIYRFRRADIDMFLKARESIAATVVELAENFRTVEPVIDWINHVFTDLIQPQAGMQPEYQPLVATRAPSSVGAPVTLLGAVPHAPAADADRVSAERLRAFEADDVVAAIQTALAEGWLVGSDHGDDGEWRAAQPSDICVLIPARTSLHFLEERLDAAGIPYRAETSSLVYNTREVRELLMALRAVDDPSDSAALVSTLRTSLYGCGDDDLFDYRVTAGGRWSLYESRPESLPVDHPVVEALAHLRSLHEQRHWLAPSELMDRLVRERRVLEQGYASGRPRDLWRRIRFVVDQARAFADAGGGTLREFLRWATLQSAEGARVVESVLPETDDDSVRILTVHGAKGLEFPITIVSGLTTAPSGRQRGARLAFPPGVDFAVRFGAGLVTDEFERFAPLDEQMDFEEKLRLLYVATTRARDHLVVSVHRAARDKAADAPKSTLAELVWRSCGEAPQLWSPLRPTTLPRPARTHDVAEPARLDLDEWEAEIASVLAAARVPRSWSATAIAKRGAVAVEVPVAEPGLEKEPRDLELPAWQRGRYGTAIGRAVHGVLQTIDLDRAVDLDAAVAAQAAAEGVLGSERRIGQLVRSALASNTVRAAVASGNFWRESYVATTIGDRVVEGYVDLIYRRDDGLVVVDYKTDVIRSDAELATKVSRYRLQGATYAYAVGEATGETIAEVVFVFCGLDGARESRVDDLAGAIAEVIDVVNAG
jgi:ATP-dependent exoDNAse (exonuclease V) beta subunit